MGALFGTDGIRGKANTDPMTVDTALQVGKVMAAREGDGPVQVVVGRDTRLSGDMLTDAISAGICAAGGTAIRCGVVPTPAVAFLVRHLEADAGIVVSASHNPYEDNGIKLFDRNGYKLSDAHQAELERRILAKDVDPAEGKTPGRRYRHLEAEKQYTDFITNTYEPTANARPLHIVIDCANGAAYQVAPRVFHSLEGIRCQVIHNAPDGRNINDGCGSQHLESLIATVRRIGADVGFAFDGDADRMMAVDERGHPLTGDQAIAIFARHLLTRGRLDGRRVVTTVMSNIGLRNTLQELDIVHDMCDVGDRYVMEMMQRKGAVLGGEDSGHIIFHTLHSTGDGILAAVQLLNTMRSTGSALSELAAVMTVFPQALIAVPVSAKPPLGGVAPVCKVIRQVEAALGNQGRVLVRYSGTQPVCRVMVEGPDSAMTESYCRQIADIVAECLQ